jgi:hypothetical protein
MLKYQPTRFWGMIKNKSNLDQDISAEQFAKFN